MNNAVATHQGKGHDSTGAYLLISCLPHIDSGSFNLPVSGYAKVQMLSYLPAIPSAKWSLSNRLLQFLADTSDARGYGSTIQSVISADKTSQRNVLILTILLAMLVLAASYIMGLPYLIINCGLFAAFALSALSKAARSGALDHVLTLASILYSWHSEDVVECEWWLEHVPNLRPLYNILKTV